MKLNVNRQTAKCKVLLKINNIHGRLQELTDIGGSTQRTSCLKIVKVYISPFTLQWRRYRGAGGAWAPPTFYPGGQSTPKLFDHRSTKIALLLARNLHCKKRINFQAQLIKQTRGFAFVF